MLEVRKKKRKMKNEVCNHVHQKIPQTQNTYLPFWFSFLLLLKSTTKSKKLGTYQPSRQISRPQTTIFCGNIYKLLVAKFVTASQETEIPSPQMALNFLYLVECTAVIEPRFSLFVFANSLPDCHKCLQKDCKKDGIVFATRLLKHFLLL